MWKWHDGNPCLFLQHFHLPVNQFILLTVIFTIRKVVFTGVCDSVHRMGCVSQHGLGQTPPPADTSLPSACWDTHPPAQCMLGYMPAPRGPLQRTVRILLKCIPACIWYLSHIHPLSCTNSPVVDLLDVVISPNEFKFLFLWRTAEISIAFNTDIVPKGMAMSITSVITSPILVCEKKSSVFFLFCIGSF